MFLQNLNQKLLQQTFLSGSNIQKSVQNVKIYVLSF